MTIITTQDERDLIVVREDLAPFAIGVPHQRPAFVTDPSLDPPVEEDGDSIIEGDHDLHGVDLIETIRDAACVIEQRSADKHQAIKRAVLCEEELINQGVLEEEQPENE